MHKTTLWLILTILCIYYMLVLCEDSNIEQEFRPKPSSDLWPNGITSIQDKEAARTKIKHRYHLHSLWGFYGLAVAYLVKVKIVVVAFLVGSAVYLGLRYAWPHKCPGSEIYKEGPIVFDHPPHFAHHDHVPYALDHEHYHNEHFDSGSFASSGPASFDPYPAYSGATFPSGADGPADALTSDGVHTNRRTRSVPNDLKEQETGLLENLARQMVAQEEQIGEFMLNFLGLDTTPCRRRFVCEMEFRTQTNPLTSMAFQVIGRSLFAKYTNDHNPLRKATSFAECAAINAECVFIENNEEVEEDATDAAQLVESTEQSSTNELNRQPATSASFLKNNNTVAQANEDNLRAELRTSFRKRLRGDRHLKLKDY